MYARNFVYQEVSGWEAFEPGLSRVEQFDPEAIREIAGDIPPEWTGHDWGALEKLVEQIIERRSKVRDLITAFRNSSRQPFPAWGQPTAKAQKAAVQ